MVFCMPMNEPKDINFGTRNVWPFEYWAIQTSLKTKRIESKMRKKPIIPTGPAKYMAMVFWSAVELDTECDTINHHQYQPMLLFTQSS